MAVAGAAMGWCYKIFICVRVGPFQVCGFLHLIAMSCLRGSGMCLPPNEQETARVLLLVFGWRLFVNQVNIRRTGGDAAFLVGERMLFRLYVVQSLPV